MSLEELQVREEAHGNEEEDIARIRELATHLKESLDAHAARNPDFGAISNQYTEILEGVKTWHPRDNPQMESIVVRLEHLPITDPLIRQDIETFLRQARPLTSAIENTLSSTEGARDYVLRVLPHFVYFSGVDEIEDSVPLEVYREHPAEHRTLANLIRLSGLDVEGIMEAGLYQKLSAFRTASATITGLVNESWTQESVEVNVDLVDDRIVVSIYDDVMKQLHPPSIRSQGFRWFLSFYIDFMAGSRSELTNTTILLDDPGVYLHASGQKDLLATLESLSDTNQVVFSTHSPFMVDRQKLERIRIVSKEQEKGTIIQEKFYVSDFDALQPIRASIGMTIGDSLFTTKRNLLVEGYSDDLILHAMSECCLEAKEHCLDTSEVSILPVMGADKMPYFATLLTKENLDFFILLDHDSKGRKAKKELIERFMIPEDRIRMLDVVGEEGQDLVIENVIDFGFYLEAVNLAYQPILESKLGKPEISKDEIDGTSFQAINDYFRDNVIGRSKKVDKIKVAKAIHDMVADGKRPQEDTVARFSKLFELTNEALSVP